MQVNLHICPFRYTIGTVYVPVKAAISDAVRLIVLVQYDFAPASSSNVHSSELPRIAKNESMQLVVVTRKCSKHQRRITVHMISAVHICTLGDQ
jgi:hypothetical protein